MGKTAKKTPAKPRSHWGIARLPTARYLWPKGVVAFFIQLFGACFFSKQKSMGWANIMTPQTGRCIFWAKIVPFYSEKSIQSPNIEVKQSGCISVESQKWLWKMLFYFLSSRSPAVSDDAQATFRSRGHPTPWAAPLWVRYPPVAAQSDPWTFRLSQHLRLGQIHQQKWRFYLIYR